MNDRGLDAERQRARSHAERGNEIASGCFLPSQIIVVGLEDIQNRMLQTDLTSMTSVVFAKADLQRKPKVASAYWLAQAAAPRA